MQEGKWQPGHYVFIDSESITDKVILDHFKGVQRLYRWRDLEPEKGKYDFSSIKKDLDYLGSKGKYLVVQLTYKSFGKDVTFAPDYLKGEEYGGSPFVSTVGALNPVVWNKNVRERIGALISAMGKELDDNPYLAGVNLPETAVNYRYQNPQEGIEEYTPAKYAETMKYFMDSLRKSFPHTVVIQYTNFPKDILPELINYQEKAGVGLGGPDVYPGDDKAVSEGVYRFYAQLAGKVPLGAAVQSENYSAALKKQSAARRGEKVTITPEDQIPFPVREHLKLAQNRLHLNYMFWSKVPAENFENVKKLLAEPDLAGDPAGGLDSRIPDKTFVK